MYDTCGWEIMSLDVHSVFTSMFSREDNKIQHEWHRFCLVLNELA